jgi:hypothetical protein
MRMWTKWSTTSSRRQRPSEPGPLASFPQKPSQFGPTNQGASSEKTEAISRKQIHPSLRYKTVQAHKNQDPPAKIDIHGQNNGSSRTHQNLMRRKWT